MMKACNSGIDVTAEVVHLSRILNAQFVNVLFAYNEKSETLINGVGDHIKLCRLYSYGMRGLSNSSRGSRPSPSSSSVAASADSGANVIHICIYTNTIIEYRVFKLSRVNAYY